VPASFSQSAPRHLRRDSDISVPVMAGDAWVAFEKFYWCCGRNKTFISCRDALLEGSWISQS
jgi:hypothetical protein